MTEKETAMVLDILNIAYPNAFSRMSEAEKKAQFQLWLKMFENENARIVLTALYASIEGNKYPPTVADIKERMKPMRPDDTETDLHFCWSEYLKGLQGNRTFEELPEAVRKYVGSKEALLKQQLDESLYEVLYTVEKSNFYKQVHAIIAGVENRQQMERLLGTEKYNELKGGTGGIKRLAGEVPETGRAEIESREEYPF